MEKICDKETVVKDIKELKGEHFDLAKKTIESWPNWKREVFNKVVQLTT